MNAICPGLTATQLVEDQLEGLAGTHNITREEVLEQVFFPDIPQKRVLAPEEIAECALYLASTRAAAITGQAINVSAGWVMQ